MTEIRQIDITDSDATDVERIENRMVGRALSHWDDLRGDRNFPTYEDYSAQETPYGDEHVFVISIRDSELSDEIVAAGQKVEEGFGRSPVGLKAIEAIPSSIEKGLSFCRTAARMKKPIADVGHFSNANGTEICYRSILLPLSSDQINVDHILGAFSFKVME
ncbi:MAG: hypothetical protein HQ514_04685 [Rhodospirillales bacterium]|nr:hypothetical protein [Rhodospirillales bacterium]